MQNIHTLSIAFFQELWYDIHSCVCDKKTKERICKMKKFLSVLMALTLLEDAPLLKSTATLDGRACTVFTHVTDEVNFRYYVENQHLLRLVIEKEDPITVDFS